MHSCFVVLVLYALLCVDESPPESLSAWKSRDTSHPTALCVFPSRARVWRPVHSPFTSLSVRVNTHVSGFATSLIIVGPVTTPSDRLYGVAWDLSPKH